MHKFSVIAAKPVAALIVLTCVSAIPAQASPPVSEVFSHNANANGIRPLQSTASMKHDAETPKIGAGALAMMGNLDKPIVKWFEEYDRAKNDAKPTPSEQLILSRPMNQEFARVQEFITTIGRISKRFRALAKTLRKMPVQDNWGQVKDLRDGEADFYEQTASVFEEMTKPRPPSKTKEELVEKQKELQDHAESTKKYGDSLISMDRGLRSTFGVHLDRSTDDLAKYVMGTQKEGNYVFPK